ncbi:F-box/kelch-repeat protein At3g06240-like [Rosa rugosa]|uniref:F-box/kelch-repeat protein At3g06240-like n=1 Tax=Rosa rugosa TaxID=74645 RepID=UPI002B40EB4B|nr:F-box/kelch-repeat protein At3g06240-like [Rosa rugosa]
MEDRGEPNLYLPPEIMDDILLWLPAKSLCRFKCVSKPWKAMISDTHFVKRHINRATENKDVFLQRRRVIFTDAADNGLYTLDLDEFLKNHKHVLLKNHAADTDNGIDNDDDEEDEQVAATKLDYIYREQPSVRVPFFHSCNGLILLELSDLELYLVNPATSESKHLAKPPLDYYEFHNYNYHLYGFGFDSSSSQYQLVQGDICIHDDDIFLGWWGTWFSVYNFETDSWRHKLSSPHPYIPASSQMHRNENGVMLNGRFHWLMKSLKRYNYDDEAFVIVALDAPLIRTREIPLPPELSSGSQLVKLGAFREWLCITLATVEPHHAETYSEFWVMKEYGVRESWTKMRVSIPYAELSHSGFWTESHDLMVFGERLILYNFDEENPQSFQNLSVREIGKVGRVGVYIESLVSVRDLIRDLNNMRINPWIDRRRGKYSYQSAG